MKFLFSLVLFWPSLGFGVCLDLIKGPIIMEVSECRDANPQVGSPAYKEFPDWVRNLEANLKTKLLSGHQGILIKGKVTDSQVTPLDVKSMGKDVKGTEITVFVHNTQGLNCSAASKKLIEGFLGESCCDTGSEIPCLWDTGYYLKGPKPISKPVLPSKAATDNPTGQKKPNFAGKNPVKSDNSNVKSTLNRANNFYLAGHFKDTAKLLFDDWTENANNPQWIWLLTQSLKQQDMCTKCIKPLERHSELYDKGELSLQHEDKIADSIFLLARCYAKTGKREEAVNILHGMLYKKRLFKKQIAQSKNHPDLSSLQALPSFQNYIKSVNEQP